MSIQQAHSIYDLGTSFQYGATASGEAHIRRYVRVPFTSTKPPPPPKASVEESELIPEAKANWFSLVTFEWVSPLLALGYARPLEAPDLWRLQDERGSAVIAEQIIASFDRRTVEAAEFNGRLANGEIKPGLRKLWWMRLS